MTNLVIFPQVTFFWVSWFFVRAILLIPQFEILETFQTHLTPHPLHQSSNQGFWKFCRQSLLFILLSIPAPLSSSLDDYNGFLLRVFHFFIHWRGSFLMQLYPAFSKPTSMTSSHKLSALPGPGIQRPPMWPQHRAPVLFLTSSP